MILRPLPYLFAFLLCGYFSRGQDQLFKRDNAKLLVKILEITDNEIKYKLHSNLNGPTYSEDRNNVVLILYENGKSEVFTTNAPTERESTGIGGANAVSRKDSLAYYGCSNNISINFLNFFNSEIGLIYQKEFFNSNFNIIIPVAVGLEIPYITQSVWFGSSSPQSSVQLNNKIYEIGLGINYYPKLGDKFNYFIGPVFRYMEFDCTLNHSYYTGATNYTQQIVSKNSTLSRYSMTITNGIVFRTKSKLTSTVFASLGFKNDHVADHIVDPITNQEINSIPHPVSFNVWLGFNIGFNF